MTTEEPLSLKEKLLDIQQELKAPKDSWNEFSKYNYRSAESILEAVKPLCKKHELVLLLGDNVKQIGDRYYIEATAKLLDDDDEIAVTASAREEETKKGMDAAQITGAASSYARKYALSGLFAIDDTKDADSYDNRSNSKPQARKQASSKEPLTGPASDKQKALINTKLEQEGVPKDERVGYLIEQFGVTDPKNMTKEQASFVIETLIGVKNA